MYNSKKFFENSSEFYTFGLKTNKSQYKGRTNAKHQSLPLNDTQFGAACYTTKPSAKNPHSWTNLDMEFPIPDKSSKTKDKYYTIKTYDNEPYSYKGQTKCRDSSNYSHNHYKRCCSTSSTQPSSEDSEVLRRNVEGYKVVQGGNIIHDSLLSDSESDSQNEKSQASSPKRFATATSNLGPSSKEISLPSFLKDL